jgi:hypothetical protein
LPPLATAEVRFFTGRQRYHLEIWAEKSTMNDVLTPLCSLYHVNLMTASGELSITQVHDGAQRIIASGKPARILYLSDFDPAGQDMPVSAARKLEWFLSSTHSPLADQLAGADIRLRPVVLTQAQCVQYGLPRTPIKESDKRKEGFEDRFGDGATELDALEALYPGRLADIMRDGIRPYWDWELDKRVREAQAALERHLRERLHAVRAEHQAAIDAIRSEYDRLSRDYTPQVDALNAEFAPRLAAINEQYAPQVADLNEQLREHWEALQTAWREEIEGINLDDWPIPEAEDAYENDEDDPPLYASGRDYETQLDAYKAFQGRADDDSASSSSRTM